MGHIGPYQPGNTVRIPLEVIVNGVATAVSNARVQRLIVPDGTDLAGFPRAMTTLKDGTYMLEIVLTVVGSYTAIIQAEYGVQTIKQIAEFVIEKPFGFPRIEIATDH